MVKSKIIPGVTMDEYKAFQPPAAALQEAPAIGLVLADRGTRLGAKLLDGIILGGVGFVAGIFFAFSFAMNKSSSAAGTPALFGTPAIIAVGCAIGLCLLALMVWNLIWLHRYGQTIGKRVTGIRILRQDGSRVSLGRIILLRFLPVTILGAIPLIGGIFSLLDALLIFRDSAQCLHDQIADTIVVAV